jgi:zinc protease
MRASLALVLPVLLAACGASTPPHGLPASASDKRLREAVGGRLPPTDEALLEQRPDPLAVRARRRIPVTEARLSNGVRVLAVQRMDFPSVALSFVLDRGTCDGGAAASVYADAIVGSSTEHEGHDNLSYLRFVGAPLWSDAYEDATVFSTEVLEPLLASAVSRMAPMFLSPALEASDLEWARDYIRSELTRAPVREALAARRRLRQLLLGPRAYGWVLADPREVKKVSDAEVRELRRTILAPSHVTVIAVGAFKLEHLVTMLESATKNLPQANDVRPSTCDAPPIPAPHTAIHLADDPRAAQSQIAVGAIGVHAGHRDAAALDVLAAAMGASLSSRLSLVIRENHGMTYGVRMRALHWRTRGTIEVLTSVESARSRDAVRGILAELAHVATDALDERELARAKAHADPDDGAHSETAYALVPTAAYGMKVDAADVRRRAIAAVTIDDIKRVAATYLAREKLAIAVVGNAEQIATSLTDVGFGNVELEK